MPVVRRVTQLADWCAAMVAKHALAIEILGPAPCPITRIKDRWRYHILLKGDGKPLGRLVRTLAPRVGGGKVRVAIDRDPASLL